MDAPEPTDDDAPPYPPPATGRPPGRPWTIAGFMFAVVAFLLYPVWAGAAGVFCGVMGMRRGDPLGRSAAIAATVCMIAAIVLFVIVRG